MVRIALRMILDDPLKSLGTLLGVVFAVFLMAQQLSILLGILSRVTAFVDNNDVDIWIAGPATESTEAAGTVPEQRVSQAASVDGVLWAAPIVVTIAEVTKPNGVKEQVRVVGVEPPLLAGLPRTLHPGTVREGVATPGRVFLDWGDRKQFAFVNAGDRIELSGRMAIVEGFTTGMLPFGPYYVFTNIQDARGYAASDLRDRITYVAVKIRPGEDPVVVRDRLKARVPDVVVVTSDEMRNMNRRYFLRRTPVGYVFGMGTILAAVIGTIIVTVTLFSAVVDRSREYGTLKALGATGSDLRRLLRLQALLFAAAGYSTGIVIFGLLKLGLRGSPVVLVTPPWVLALIAVLTVGLCMAASVLAIRRVLQLEPAMVFRG